MTGPQPTPSRQEIEHLIDAHGATLGRRDPHRWRLGTKRLMDWLESVDGATWQDRWDAAGVEAEDSRWTGVLGLNKDYEHYAVTAVFQALLCLRLIRPGYAWLVRQPFSSLAAQMRLGHVIVDVAPHTPEAVDRFAHAVSLFRASRGAT